MGNIKYRTNGDDKIKGFEVIKETKTRITFRNVYTTWNGKEQERIDTENKESRYQSWHDTFEDAKAYLINGKIKSIESYEHSILYLKTSIEKINALTE